MTHLSTSRSLCFGLADRFLRARERVEQDRARRAEYRRTYHVLSSMSDRDLSDIGISRLQVRDVARDAAHRR
jgi:uncharacterized protein YjiS (DUF1127 family)